MIIIYHCYGSAHTSVIASAIHLGLLPANRVPTSQEILTLPYYDQINNEQIGNPYYIGKDEFNSRVYILGLANNKDVVIRSIFSLLKIYGIPSRQLLMVDSLVEIHYLTRIGGFLSRRLGLVKLGRPLTVKGIQSGYFPFVRLVNEVKKKLKDNAREKEKFKLHQIS